MFSWIRYNLFSWIRYWKIAEAKAEDCHLASVKIRVAGSHMRLQIAGGMIAALKREDYGLRRIVRLARRANSC